MTASAFTRPALMFSAAAPAPTGIMSTCPPISAVRPGPSPSKGTEMTWNLVTEFSIEPTVCGSPPGPVEPILSLPGRFFASSTKSLSEFHGASFFTTMTATPRPSTLTG